MIKRLETIFMLLFALAVVVALFWQISLNRVDTGIPMTPDDMRIAIVDSVYISKPFFFTMRSPGKGWTMTVLSRDTLLTAVDTTRALEPQISWILRMNPAEDSSLTRAKIGMLKWPAPFIAREVAISFLAEMLERYEIKGGRAEIVVGPTTPAHHIMQGAYFVVKLPGTGESAQIRIFCLLPRRQFAYIIQSETDEESYPYVRLDLEKIVSRFRPLPMLEKTIQ